MKKVIVEKRNEQGNLHCLDGPAFVQEGGVTWYIITGYHVHTGLEFREKTGMSEEDYMAMVLKWGEVGNYPLSRQAQLRMDALDRVAKDINEGS